MKNLVYILFIFSASYAGAQEWRDSLKVARDAYKNQEYAKALKYYQSVQSKAPENIDLSDEMAQSAYKAREFEKAEKIYQQGASLKKSKNEKADAYHNMGNSRMQKKDYSGAIDSYKEALRNDPSDEQTRYNLSEAIRRLKNEQQKQQEQDQKNPPKNDKQNNQNNDKKQNSGNDKNKEQNKQPENKGNDKNDKQDKGGNSSKLPNKSVERMLDQLTKAEADTKRKIGSNKEEGNSIKSGKDW